MAKVAIMGFGTVGSGVGEVLKMNEAVIARRAGQPVELKYILDLRDFPGSPFEHLLVKDFSVIENDPEVQVVAECMGGVGAAKVFTERALKAGKSVVTSNKELVATYGVELFRLAREHNVNYLFEAAVGGGIPIIRPLVKCLAANQIKELFGILNGTTNYILTKMIREGTAFDAALKQAQQNGYAEQDPTADIEGFDACRKTSILASLISGRYVAPDKIHTVGITGITAEDVSLSAAAGRKIKLLGRVIYLADGRLAAYVSPHLISDEQLLSSVDDVFNGIVVRGNAVDELMFYGRGAGKLPTASAVAGDLVDAVKHTGGQHLSMEWAEADDAMVGSMDELSMRWYVRINENDDDVQKLSACTHRIDCADVSGHAGFMTEAMTRPELDALLSGIQVLSCLPVLD